MLHNAVTPTEATCLITLPTQRVRIYVHIFRIAPVAVAGGVAVGVAGAAGAACAAGAARAAGAAAVAGAAGAAGAGVGVAGGGGAPPAEAGASNLRSSRNRSTQSVCLRTAEMFTKLIWEELRTVSQMVATQPVLLGPAG